MIELSIIIVNWNVCDLLEACLRSIEEHIGLEPNQYEVLIVDNNSSDNSAQMVRERFPYCKLTVNDDNLGFGRANNQAFPESQGNYILLLNPDAELQAGSVVRMLQLMKQDPKIGIVGARLVNSDGSFQRSGGGALPTLYNTLWHYFFLYTFLPDRWGPVPTYLREDVTGTFDIGWVSGAALMLRREALALDTTIFDNRFFLYGEDLELCNRIQTSGWRVCYTSEASVLHHLRRSVFRHSSPTMLAAAIKGNRAYFQLKHSRFKTWVYDLILSIGYLVRWPATVIVSLVKPSKDYSEEITANRLYAWTSLKLLCRLGKK